jgi:hypothetical protein
MSSLRRVRHRKRPGCKTVFEHAYSRFRFGQCESLISNFRSHPGRMSFDFYVEAKGYAERCPFFNFSAHGYLCRAQSGATNMCTA